MPHVASIVLSCLAVLSCGCFSYKVRVEIPSAHEADLDGIGKVRVESANGRVRISCRPGAEGLRVSAVRFARGETEEEAREHAAAVVLELGQDPDAPETYRVKAEVPQGLWPYSCGASFDLELPPGTDLDVHTSNGSISIAGGRGEATVRTSNGRVEVTDFEGDLETRTSNGEIRLHDIAGGEIAAVTSNGGIHLSLVRTAGHPHIKAHTSNGSIELEVPPEVEAEVSLRTSNGSVSRDLGAFRVTELEASRRKLSAVLNGGGGRIEASTSNGGIRFRPSR